MNKKVSNARVAEILRAARDLMNHGGRHWIKGTEKGPLAEYKDDADEITYPPDEIGYCSIGGIREVAKNDAEHTAACIELAYMMDPTLKETMKEDYEAYVEEQEYWYPGTKIDSYDTFVMNNLYPEDLIAETNDDYDTDWKDVKGWFTKAARRASQRKD